MGIQQCANPYRIQRICLGIPASQVALHCRGDFYITIVSWHPICGLGHHCTRCINTGDFFFQKFYIRDNR